MTLSELIGIARQNNVDIDDYNQLIWKQQITEKEKIILSLQAFDHHKTSYFLMTLWLEYSVSGKTTREFDKIIYNKYQSELSHSTGSPGNAIEYSLFFDIFQAPERQLEAWNYFLENNPTDKFLLTMLRNAAPIPYPTKGKLYESLITNQDFHMPIYKSIRDSCTYTRGYAVTFDKPKALELLLRLNITEQIPELDKEKVRDTYAQILGFLTTQNRR
jgi:hypothetical protein